MRRHEEVRRHPKTSILAFLYAAEYLVIHVHLKISGSPRRWKGFTVLKGFTFLSILRGHYTFEKQCCLGSQLPRAGCGCAFSHLAKIHGVGERLHIINSRIRSFAHLRFCNYNQIYRVFPRCMDRVHTSRVPVYEQFPSLRRFAQTLRLLSGSRDAGG